MNGAISARTREKESTVLYIEDNPSNVHLVERLLSGRSDVTLRTAMRGGEGLEMARVEPPRLILLDLHLPDMPGTDVLRGLREHPRTAAVPVVVISADATPRQISQMRASGATDYITKPFEVPRLLAVIDAFVASDPGAGGASAPGERDTNLPVPDEPTPDEPILDPARVTELRGLDADGAAFGSLSDLALDEAAEQVTAICVAAASPAGATALSAGAHGLKSSAAIVGARWLLSLADAIERKARAGAMPDAALLDELRRALAATKQAVIDVYGRC